MPAGHKKANPASVASQRLVGRAGRNRKLMILLIGKLRLILYMGKELDSMLLDHVLMDFSVKFKTELKGELQQERSLQALQWTPRG
jgi:hypothetical protein